jgi:hypothetical protein
MLMDKRHLVREMLKKFQHPNLEQVLMILNSLVTRNFIRDYAISGSYAALYYGQPILTFDLDVCCLFPGIQTIVDMSSIYQYLSTLGHKPAGEYVPIEGIPVQFIAAAPGSLSEEAVKSARSITFQTTPTRIVQLEHLMAMMIELARPRDIAKLAVILEEGRFNNGILANLLRVHHLDKKWQAIQKRIYEPVE